MCHFLGFPAAFCEGISLVSEETILFAASAHREDKNQAAVVWHLLYSFVQKVRNAAETSVVCAGPQNHLAGLNNAPTGAQCLDLLTSVFPVHHLLQLWHKVTSCPFTRLWFAHSVQQGGGPTSGTCHGEAEPSHSPFPLGTAELWDLLNQTCRVVWTHYARKMHKKKRGRERQSSLGTSMFNNPFKPPQTSFTKPHRLSLNFFVQIFAFINSPRSFFCFSASQNATRALSKCWDFTGTHFWAPLGQ